MKQYLDLMHNVFLNGAVKEDRTGTGTKSLFGQQMRFNLADGFPLVTTKKCHLKSIIHELLWFLQGDTNVRYLKENGVSIWDDWVKPETAEYRDLTIDELRAALVTRFKGHQVKSVAPMQVVNPSDTDITFKVIDGELILQVSQVLSADLCVPGEFEQTELNGLRYAAKFYGLSTQKLIAGELGPVYGSQWRDWPIESQSTIDALIELSCLGMGSKWGNSNGNVIARRALLKIPGIAHNKKAYMSSGLSYANWLDKASAGSGAYSENGGIDQIANIVNMLKNNPDGRRIIVSAWNPAEVDKMALPPCHALFQFYSAPLTAKERGEWYHGHSTEEEQFEKQVVPIADILDRKFDGLISEEAALAEIAAVYDSLGVPQRRLSCQLYQRSADVFLGVPFNIASYALLTLMVAQVTNMVPGEFIWTGGDCHIYTNHMEQAALQLGRAPLPLPTMKINPDVKDLLAFKFEDFELVDYQAHPHIAGKVAV